ncbi:hypothetical protein CONPUDRAFT_85546 [Coniophora puteana RWD-64-598 SS2]|uniref:Uncharacterized protein n=1 Tax=Coniophora puteana (strain RWD-64-598) TaxID=741705 RepID=A0A5M3M8R8_CONPW|nr:uncharacterized protein CONPUDRAFT_85546 [Coniophora puteana RWD-64-598 SS2]EIW75326.1 hypothetical protein CONPUDRAFT_85546 [Coniophora puteana RWD-64-598 SS2]
MDDTVYPPVRLQPLASRPLSEKHAQASIDAFLDSYYARGMQNGGSADSTVTAQLQKLSAALKDGRAREKALRQ